MIFLYGFLLGLFVGVMAGFFAAALCAAAADKKREFYVLGGPDGPGGTWETSEDTSKNRLVRWKFCSHFVSLVLILMLAGCVHVALPNGAGYTAVGTNTSIGLAVYNPETGAFVIMDYSKVTDPNFMELLTKGVIGATGYIVGGGI